MTNTNKFEKAITLVQDNIDALYIGFDKEKEVLTDTVCQALMHIMCSFHFILKFFLDNFTFCMIPFEIKKVDVESCTSAASEL